jgi:hypothetical protein
MDKYRVMRCLDRKKGWYVIFTGSKEEAEAEFTRLKPEIEKGGVQVLTPNGLIHKMHWALPPMKSKGSWKRGRR